MPWMFLTALYARTAPSRDPGVSGQCLSFPLYSSEIEADKMSAVVPRYPVLESRFRLRLLTSLAAGRWSSHILMYLHCTLWFYHSLLCYYSSQVRRCFINVEQVCMVLYTTGFLALGTLLIYRTWDFVFIGCELLVVVSVSHETAQVFFSCKLCWNCSFILFLEELVFFVTELIGFRGSQTAFLLFLCAGGSVAGGASALLGLIR